MCQLAARRELHFGGEGVARPVGETRHRCGADADARLGQNTAAHQRVDERALAGVRIAQQGDRRREIDRSLFEIVESLLDLFGGGVDGLVVRWRVEQSIPRFADALQRLPKTHFVTIRVTARCLSRPLHWVTESFDLTWIGGPPQ